MSLLKENFPYPVLSNAGDDYIEDCAFGTIIGDVYIDDKNRKINIPIKYYLHSNGLSNLISNGDAICGVYMQCSSTFVAKLYEFKSNETEMTISIPLDDLANKISLKGQIIAKRPLRNPFYYDELNQLYFRDGYFELRKGNYLATEDKKYIYLDTSVLEKPIESICQVVVNNECDSPIGNFDGDKIMIMVNESTFSKYKMLNSHENCILNPVTLAILIKPQLCTAVKKVIDSYKDNTRIELVWANVIEHKAEQMGIDLSQEIDDIPNVVDMLLGNNSVTALDNIVELLNADINE